MSISPVFAMFGMPGGVELIVIGAIILLLFGHRLPGIMRSLGRGATEFKKGLNDTDVDSDEDEAIEASKEKQA